MQNQLDLNFIGKQLHSQIREMFSIFLFVPSLFRYISSAPAGPSGTDPENDPENDPETDPETDPENDPENNPENDPENLISNYFCY